MMADWLIWPIAGRNILEIQVDRPGDYELRQNRFPEDLALALCERALRDPSG